MKNSILFDDFRRAALIDNVYTMSYDFRVRFEWDERKSRSNARKHGVWFEEAQTVWADENSVEFFDPEHSATEDRFIRIGHSTRAHLLLVVFCERQEDRVIRIISARKATKKEERQYEKGI